MGGGEAGGLELERLESAAQVEGWGGGHDEMVGGVGVMGMSFLTLRFEVTESRFGGCLKGFSAALRNEFRPKYLRLQFICHSAKGHYALILMNMNMMMNIQLVLLAIRSRGCRLISTTRLCYVCLRGMICALAFVPFLPRPQSNGHRSRLQNPR